MSELEAEIRRYLAEGDHTNAAAAIVRGYGAEILGYLIGVSRDPATADEVFSTTTEDLWRGLPGFRGESSARTWLYRLAWHALQRHRKDPFQRRRRAISSELEQVAHDVRSRTAPFLRTEIKDEVARLREQLTPEEQTLLILRIDRGLSWREVGTVMAVDDAPLTEATLAKRFQRIKTRLRKLAVEAGLVPGK